MSDHEQNRIEHIASLALGEANCPADLVAGRVQILAPHLGCRPDGSVYVRDRNGQPKQRPDPLGSGKQFDIPVSELIAELRSTKGYFPW